MSQTRQRLLDGALEALRLHGSAGASARTIAAAAGVNQALVFYHFGSVEELLGQAAVAATRQRVEHYAADFDAVTSLGELLRLGRRLHEEERAAGNVVVLGQMLAASEGSPGLAAPTAQALALWTEQIEAVLHRVLAGSPVAEICDVPALAQAVSSAFVGLILHEGVDADGARRSLEALERLSVLVAVMDDLGPVARTALRARVRRTARRSAARPD